jgi:hypothetical protein
MNTSIDTDMVQRRTGIMLKLTGAAFAALLSLAVPASAVSVAIREPVSAIEMTAANGIGDIDCTVRLDAPLALRSSAGEAFVAGSAAGENRWIAGATSEWHAGMNRVVDRLVNPPENVNVYAAQTGDRLNGSFGATHGSDRTIAGFAIVFH